MQLITAQGEIDADALARELTAALGPWRSDRWFLVAGVGRAGVTFAAPITVEQVRAVLDAHVAPGAAAARAARSLQAGAIANSGPARGTRKVRALAKKDPVGALLFKEGL